MTIEVTDITIKIGQKKVTLSPDQAHELKDALEALLGSPEPKIVERIIERSPYRWWYVSPNWTYPYNTTTAGKWSAGNNISAVNNPGSVTLTLNQ